MTYYSGYNDAWETPAWTAQNMAYPPPNRDVLNFPTDVETVTIQGHFRDGSGRGNGWFEIDNGDTVLTHPGTKEWINPLKQRVEIRDGVLVTSVTVPATDAPALSSDSAWGYHIRISLGGRLLREGWNIALPKAVSLVDVFDIDFSGQDSSGIVITPGTSSGEFDLGTTPDALDVNLTTGSDFNTTLTLDTPWDPASQVWLSFNNGAEIWNAIIDGVNATFAVDKTIADAIPNRASVKLGVTTGEIDEIWAVGSVVRHG